MTHRPFFRLVVCLVVLCGCFATTFVIGEDQPTQNAKQRLTAAEMMKRAHEARAEWNDFTGFKADVVVQDGAIRVEGKVVVSAEGDITLQLPASNTAEGAKSGEWAEDDLQSLVSHRLSGGSREYDVAYVKGERPNALGRLIRFNDDRMHSVYRIRYNLITEVHRTMGDQKLLISVVDVHRNKEKKILPRTYTVSWSDAKTGKVSSTQVANVRWVRVGEIDLPMRVLKVINKDDGSREVHEIRLSNHELLTAAK